MRWTCKLLGQVVLLPALCIAGSGVAFEVTTHAAITNAAFDRVLLDRPRLLEDLGFAFAGGATAVRLRQQYFDISGTVANERSLMPFEVNQIELPNFRGLGFKDQSTLVNGWLMSGAIREDDNPSEGNPKDDPYQSGGAFHREFNHFFDPYYDRPLQTAGLQLLYGSQPIRKAVDWALGTANAFSDPSARDTASTWNHFTLFEAREAMFRALTLKQRNGFGYVDVAGTQTAAQAESTRMAYWATTFRALGDMLHLNQDMAQPQHTRNEGHVGKFLIEYFSAGHASAFEKYMDERARQVPRALANGTMEPPARLPFDGYPTPSFERFSDFWSTYQGVDSGRLGKGLANYSNSGFFTAGHNYGDGEYPDPPALAYPFESAAGLLPANPNIAVKFLRGDVPDRYNGTISNIRITTESLWDRRLGLGGMPVRTWNLNRFNYDDMASLLIPRAVAYSAGIIEHYFRGAMEINLPDAGVYAIVDHAKFVPSQSGTPTDVQTGFKGFDRIKLKLKNTTPKLQSKDGSLVDQPMNGGTVVAVVKFHRNVCYDDLLTQWPMTGADAKACRSPIEEIVTSDVIIDQSVPFATAGAPEGTEYTFHFTSRELPINAWDVVLQLVYRGSLGAEADAVVVATKNVSEPTFAGFMNTSDYVVINGKFYRPAEVAANQALFTMVSPGCRAGQPGSYTVSNACFNRIDSFTFNVGSSPVAITAVAETAVRPRRLARIAVLADHDIPPHFAWQVDGVSCWVFLDNPLYLQPYPAQQESDQGWTYGLPNDVRSVRVWELNVCYADIAVSVTQPDQLDFTELDALAGQENEPTPLTITGWN
jgi:hypothetical protein